MLVRKINRKHDWRGIDRQKERVRDTPQQVDKDRTSVFRGA